MSSKIKCPMPRILQTFFIPQKISPSRILLTPGHSSPKFVSVPLQWPKFPLVFSLSHQHCACNFSGEWTVTHPQKTSPAPAVGPRELHFACCLSSWVVRHSVFEAISYSCEAGKMLLLSVSITCHSLITPPFSQYLGHSVPIHTQNHKARQTHCPWEQNGQHINHPTLWSSLQPEIAYFFIRTAVITLPAPIKALTTLLSLSPVRL